MSKHDYPRKIAIIGCGTVGSMVAYNVILFSLMNPLDEIVLIDNDILEKKNLPYLFITDPMSHYIDNPKIMSLHYQLSSINPNLDINNVYDVYKDSKLSKEYYVIDCRDVSDNQYFNLKVCCDGPYCKILKKNSNLIESGKINSYLFNNSKYYCMKAAIEVCEQIFEKSDTKESYIIDFENNIKVKI